MEAILGEYTEDRYKLNRVSSKKTAPSAVPVYHGNHLIYNDTR